MPLKDGDVVLLHYTIKVVEDGEEKIYDTTKEEVAKKAGIYDPNKRYGEAVIVIGKSKLLDAIEETIREMDVGEKREIIAPPEKAYGPRRDDLIIRVPRKQLRRAGIPPVRGREVEVQGRRGVITLVTERFAYIDFNHPLAGKTLKIEIEIVKKLETDEEKIAYLASRWLGIPEDKIKVEANDGEATLELPPDIILVKDLETVIQALLNDIYELTNLKKLTVKVEFPFKREEASEKEESSEKKEEAQEANVESSSEEGEKTESQG